MKNLLILFILNISLVGSMTASELVFNPSNPQSGDTVNVTFTGNSRFDGISDIELLIYSFEEKSIYPSGFEVVLKKNDKSWTGKFIIPQNSVYCIFKVFAAGKYYDIIDNNNGLYWDIVVYSQNKPVKYSNLKAALVRLGSVSSNIERLPDLYSATKFLEKELELYPENISAELGLITTNFDTKKLSSEEFSKKLENLSKKKIDNNDINSVRSKVRTLFAINEKETAKELEIEFAKQYPTSEIAEDVLLNDISNAESLDKFVRYCNQFLEKFPNSVHKEKIFIAYISGFLQGNKIKELIVTLDSMENVPGYVYARIAKNLFEFYLSKDVLKDTKNKELLLGILDKSDAVKLSDSVLQLYKPKIYTNGEWLDILDIQTGTIKEIQGDIYRIYEPIRSKDLYLNSLELLRNNANETLYENLISVLVELGDSAKANEISEKAIINSKISDKITEYHRESCRNLFYMNDSLYNIKADSIIVESKKIKKELFQNELLNQEPYQYSLETLEGTFVDYRDLKDKIIVLNFFANWCAPCKTMFPTFDELYRDYSAVEDVELVSVNTLETNKFTKDDLKRFVVQNEISSPVVRDITDLMPRQIGITGLPTIAILDKQSRVKFLVKGYSNSDKLIEEISDRIEFLLSLEE